MSPRPQSLDSKRRPAFDVEAYQKWSAQQFRIQAVATN